ncbi:MAG TPA: efflux RND transporter periplasmic adaptor subunit [Thermoanaerobaculia bacterium]|nr:efflux RND transporter periplasmic adaptor subunit [Thermoanaerobaculia bacterium]
MVRKFLKLSGALLVVLALGYGIWFLLNRPLSVQAQRPRRGELLAEVFGTGTLESKVLVGVSAKIVGKVVQVLVDQGDTVTTGQILARLENRDFEDAARVAAAQCDQARTELAKAKAETQRRRLLMKQEFISHEELETYEATERVAEAQVRNSEAALGVSNAKLADTRIISPASGLVITRNLEMGATVVPGTPIFRVAATTPWVVAQVDERATGLLRLGQPVRVVFQTDPTRPEPGHIARLASETDRVTEEREVDVAVDRLPSNNFIGQRADVYIEMARKQDAMQVPLTALVERDGKPGVFVIEGGRARWRPVQTGLKGRNAAEIVSGLTARELVIVNPLAGDKPIAEGARVAAASAGKRP